MRGTVAVKMILLAVLGIVSATTSYYFTRQEAQATATPQPAMPTGDSVFVNLSKASIRRSAATYADGFVAFHAAASLMDKSPNASYVWAFRVLDADKTIVASHVYKDQIFSVPADRLLKPTLDEAFKLPLVPGQYRTEIYVFRVPPEGVNVFHDEDFAENFTAQMTGAMGGAKFTVN